MNSQSYKTTVGAFVLGGLALLVLGIILLGGGRLFSNDLEYVLYFDGSVSGLTTGAPVVFRGVPMGSVTRINLVANARDSNVTIPVYVRIDERSFVRASGSTSPSESMQQEIVRRMVQASTREGDWCLDFFAGSGTLGAVAQKLGRKFVLVDENPKAIEVMERRIAAPDTTTSQQELFVGR